MTQARFRPSPMTPRRFDWHVRVHGVAVGAWPTAEREAAWALLQVDAPARARLAAALLALDDGRGAAGPEERDMLERMRRRVQARVGLRSTAAPALRWSLRSGALAACLAAGLWAGGLLDHDRDPLATVQVAALEALR